MITLGITASASSSYPAKPGIKGVKIKTLNYYFFRKAVRTRLYISLDISLFTTESPATAEMKYWFSM